MSSDDEVAVVFFLGYWYVYIVHGGNAWVALIYGQRFDTYEEALSEAHFIDDHTEYGVCTYKKYDPFEDKRFVKDLQHKPRLIGYASDLHRRRLIGCAKVKASMGQQLSHYEPLLCI
jgi:hypothetical protein